MNKLKHWVVIIASFSFIAIIIYSPSLAGPWQYDDHAQILDKPVLTAHTASEFLVNSFRILPEKDGRLTNRDFVRGTFRLNWDWWGRETAGYRWVNLSVHVANAFLVAVLVWLLIEGTKSISKKNLSFVIWNFEFKIAALSGLLFLVHPLQSQATAYIAQRFTSVATLFYLLTIVSILKALKVSKTNSTFDKTKRRSPLSYVDLKWYAVAILSAILAYASKEITITLSIALLLLFLTLRNKLKIGNWKLIIMLVPVALLALKIPLQVMWSSSMGDIKNITSGAAAIGDSFALKQKAEELTRREYFLTQTNVVRTYLRLVVLPVGQSLDWDYPLSKQVDLKVILSGSLHLALVLLGLWLIFKPSASLVKYQTMSNRQKKKFKAEIERLSSQVERHSSLKLIGVGILWFYLTVLPESSLIPIIDVIYEHRVYLPFVGICLVFAGSLSLIESKIKNRNFLHLLLVTCYLLLSLATMRRAYIWGDEIRLWGDIWAKAPQKARANKNYGVVLAAGGKYSEGIERLRRAVELDPENADYWGNLGTAYLRAELFEQALPNFMKAYTLYVENLGGDVTILEGKNAQQAAQYLNDYGVSLVRLNRGEEALKTFKNALEIDDTLYAAWLGLGASKNLVGDIDGAIEAFEYLVETQPDKPDAYNNLATMYRKAGRDDDAQAILKRIQGAKGVNGIN